MGNRRAPASILLNRTRLGALLKTWLTWLELGRVDSVAAGLRSLLARVSGDE